MHSLYSLIRPHTNVTSYSVTPTLMSGYYVLSHKWLTGEHLYDPLVIRVFCLMAAALDPKSEDIVRYKEILQVRSDVG